VSLPFSPLSHVISTEPIKTGQYHKHSIFPFLHDSGQHIALLWREFAFREDTVDELYPTPQFSKARDAPFCLEHELLWQQHSQMGGIGGLFFLFSFIPEYLCKPDFVYSSTKFVVF
jgi:hypothetical protein